MNAVFADSHYWIAMANPRDPWRPAAGAARAKLGSARLFTTDEILAEFLTGVSRGGPALRNVAVEMVRAILASSDVQVIAQSRQSFLKALERYHHRSDKAYSLADCAAMNAMDAHGIRDVLTADRHFEQDGYVTLLGRE